MLAAEAAEAAADRPRHEERAKHQDRARKDTGA
jgi:hypothetical protein